MPVSDDYIAWLATQHNQTIADECSAKLAQKPDASHEERVAIVMGIISAHQKPAEPPIVINSSNLRGWFVGKPHIQHDPWKEIFLG